MWQSSIVSSWGNEMPRFVYALCSSLPRHIQGHWRAPEQGRARGRRQRAQIQRWGEENVSPSCHALTSSRVQSKWRLFGTLRAETHWLNKAQALPESNPWTQTGNNVCWAKRMKTYYIIGVCVESNAGELDTVVLLWCCFSGYCFVTCHSRSCTPIRRHTCLHIDARGTNTKASVRERMSWQILCRRQASILIL